MIRRPVAEFWSLTPRQIHLVFAGEAERIEDEAKLAANLAAYQVWRLAHMMRFKRLPKKPDDLTKKKAKGKVGASWQAQKRALEMFNTGIGGFDNRPGKGG